MHVAQRADLLQYTQHRGLRAQDPRAGWLSEGLLSAPTVLPPLGATEAPTLPPSGLQEASKINSCSPALVTPDVLGLHGAREQPALRLISRAASFVTSR